MTHTNQNLGKVLCMPQYEIPSKSDRWSK